MRTLRPIVLLLATLTLAACGGGAAPPASPTSLDRGDAAKVVNLLAIGDWGQNSEQERLVAKQMAAYVARAREPFQGCLLAGDNFYVPLSGIDDPAWRVLFEQMYDPKVLGFPFFVTLGNHDYQGGKAQIELDYAKAHPDSRWTFPGRYYRVNIPAKQPLVMVFMLDSNRQAMTDAEWAAQTKWLDEQLATVPAKTWTVCCAHHTLFSNGSHGDNGVLKSDWGPLFRNHHVDFYVCGHDHDLQHLEVEGWGQSFVLVGGGGAGTRAMRRDTRGPFSQSVNGFGHLQFTADKAVVRYVDSKGSELHAFERSRDGGVRTIKAGAVEAATTKPLEAIQGIDEAKQSRKARATQPVKDGD